MQMFYIVHTNPYNNFRRSCMATINVRIDENLKKESESIFKELGLGMTAAMTIFLKAVVRHNGIPFPLEIPNEETLKAFKEVDDISSGKKKAKKYSSSKEIKEDLLGKNK